MTTLSYAVKEYTTPNKYTNTNILLYMKEVNTKFYIKNPARLVNAFIK
jgi:hypothetical protein